MYDKSRQRPSENYSVDAEDPDVVLALMIHCRRAIPIDNS